jgi:hypothetical protein
MFPLTEDNFLNMQVFLNIRQFGALQNRRSGTHLATTR